MTNDIGHIKYHNTHQAKQEGNPQPRMTKDGYTKMEGSPTRWKVLSYDDWKWRRVYVFQISNACSYFVKIGRERVFVDPYQMQRLLRVSRP